MMPYVDAAAIEAARQIDLLSYLQAYEPGELVHVSGSTYCTREHDSLKISNGKWHWFSRGIGGRNALDYLVNVKEMPFPEAGSQLTGTPLRAMLEERYGVPAAVENDVNAAAFGEARLGAGRGAGDFLMVTYGTCVGGAIVLGGRVYRGTSSSAGEFGGMQLFSQQPAEGPWGAFYENFAAASSLVAMVRQRRPELTDGRAVCRHLDDPEVSALVDQWVRRVAYGLSTLIHIFNPPLMVLGGGILQNEALFRRIERCTRSQLMPGFEPLELKPALLGNTAGMAGAALLAGEWLNI